jgi:hypothetical protein
MAPIHRRVPRACVQLALYAIGLAVWIYDAFRLMQALQA